MPRSSLAGAVLIAAGILVTSARAEQTPTSTALLTLASRYVSMFVDRFSNVVAEERYVQDWKTTAGIQLLHRESKADFLLARVAETNTWQALRDVFEVNGMRVRDREDRMTKLFVDRTAQSDEQVKLIADESARYNISNVQRTVNHPLFVLIFLQPEYQKRFNFSVDRQDKNAGPDIWVVEYKESGKPTLVRGTANKDIQARGRIWISAADGAIVRWELQLEDNLQSAHVAATFRDAGPGSTSSAILIPFEMEEQYTIKGNAGKVTAKASYENFRQWGVKTTEVLK